MFNQFRFIFYLLITLTVISCKSKKGNDDAAIAPADIRTPVTITSVTNEDLSQYTDLNATSAFLQTNTVKSNINGYIQNVTVKVGEFARAGQNLFTLKTKEAVSLGNTINKLDPSFHFSGTVQIASKQSGYISQLLHQTGDYVQDGELLATISDINSFGFILNIPYELNKYVQLNKRLDVVLPDGTKLKGIVSSFLPSVDSISQTRRTVVKLNTAVQIPENLIAKIRIVTLARNNVPVLPKEAILADEAQTSFWVMKMIDSVTAVKVQIIKGVETGDKVEIVKPQFNTTDKILLTGNYGLGDTAKVRIVKGVE